MTEHSSTHQLLKRNFRKQIAEPVELYLNSTSADMWDKVLSSFRDLLEKSESAYLSKARSELFNLRLKSIHSSFAGFNCTEEENAKSLAVLRQRAWLAFRAKVDEQTADPVILSKLRTHFEERFRYDEHGVPRVWKPDDDIDGAFKKARDQTIELIPLYARIKPQDPSLAYELPEDAVDALDDSQQGEPLDFDTTLIVLPETKVLDITSRFRKDVDAYYVEAKRSMVSSIAQIPGWMYGVLVVLGWNEAMVVLFNPVYFAFVCCAIVSAYVPFIISMNPPL